MLQSFSFTRQHEILTGNQCTRLVVSCPILSFSEGTVIPVDKTSGSLEQALLRSLESEPTLKEALASINSNLDIKERALILQMVQQCSFVSAMDYANRTTEPQTSATLFIDYANRTTEQQPSATLSMLKVINEIEASSVDFFDVMLRRRLLYIHLAKLFRDRVGIVEKEMEIDRIKRRRQQSARQKLKRTPLSGQTSKTRVLNALIQDTGKGATRNLRQKFETYISYGSNLEHLCQQLPWWILLTLPVVAVPPCDMHLPLLPLDDTIEPTA